MWAKNNLKSILIIGLILTQYVIEAQQITLYNIRIIYKDKRKNTWGVLYDIKDDKPRLIPFSRSLKVDMLNNKEMDPNSIEFDTSKVEKITINKYRNVFRTTLAITSLAFAAGMTSGYIRGDTRDRNHMFSSNNKLGQGLINGLILGYLGSFSFLPVAVIKNEIIKPNRFHKIPEILAPYTLVNQTKAYKEAHQLE